MTLPSQTNLGRGESQTPLTSTISFSHRHRQGKGGTRQNQLAIAWVLDRFLATPNQCGSSCKGSLVDALRSSPSLKLRNAFQSLSESDRARLKKGIGQAPLRGLLSIAQESDTELFGRDLLRWADRQMDEGNLQAAMLVYHLLASKKEGSSGASVLPNFSESIQKGAAEGLAVINGEGPAGRRLEFQAHRFIEGATHPSMILGMAVGSTVFTTVRSMVLPRLLASRTAGFLTRGIGARLLASSVAFAPEVGAFWGTSKGINEILNPGSQSWDAKTNWHEIRSLALTLGFLKTTGFAFGRAGQMVANGQKVGSLSPLGQSFVKYSPAALNQAGMLTGIMMGHGAEMALGWRPQQSFGSLLTDSFVFWAQFNVGGAISQRAFPGLYRFNAQLNQRVALQELQQLQGLQNSAQANRAKEFVRGIRKMLRAGDGPGDDLSGLKPALAVASEGEGSGPRIELRPVEGSREARDLVVQMSSTGGSGDAESSGGDSSSTQQTPESSKVPKIEISWAKDRGLLHNFLSPRRNPQVSRLYDALVVADRYFQSSEGRRIGSVNQQEFLDRVISELAKTGRRGRTRFDSAYSVLQAVRSSRGQLCRYYREAGNIDNPEGVREPFGVSRISDPFYEILTRYPVERQGGYSAGTKVALTDGKTKPRTVLSKVIRLIRDLNEDPSGSNEQPEKLKILVDEMKTRQVSQKKDGTVEIKYPDGRASKHQNDGSFEVVHPDGYVISRKGNGNTMVKIPVVKESVQEDGTVQIKYPDGRISMHEPDGSFKVIGPDGREVKNGFLIKVPGKDIQKAIPPEIEMLRPISERIFEARKVLRDNKIRLVVALGSGRHGTALMDIVRNSMGENETVNGEYVLPVMLDQSMDFVHELNVYGTNHKRLPGVKVNTAKRMGLRAVHPRLNNTMLALADTVFVAMPSTTIDAVFTPDFVQVFGRHTIIVPAIKSIKSQDQSVSGMGGDSIPEWFLLRLAQAGRFDLMHNMVTQTGLGFPSEMMGYHAPKAAVNLSLNSINPKSADRVALLFVGDRSKKLGGDVTIYRASQRTIEAGSELFLAAYGSFIKNFLAPGVGYDFARGAIELGPDANEQTLTDLLETRVGRALKDSETTFMESEIPAMKKRIGIILEAVNQAGTTAVDKDSKGSITRWLEDQRDRKTAEHRRVFYRNFTGEEDLLGCTAITSMTKFHYYLWDLLEWSRGYGFEKRLEKFGREIKELGKSSNFTVGLLRPILEELFERGKVIEPPPWGGFTAEGVNGLPNAEARWGDRTPLFVRETSRWLQRPYPEPKPDYHETGVRVHAIDVTTDSLNYMINRIARLEAMKEDELSRDDLLSVVSIADQAIQFLENEIEKDPPIRGPKSWSRNLGLLKNELERFRETTKSLPENLTVSIVRNRIKPFLATVRDIALVILDVMTSNPDQLLEFVQRQGSLVERFNDAQRKLEGFEEEGP